MHLHIEEPFRNICRCILAANRTIAEWSECESDDMFQQGGYVGGFDADEKAFCFSVYRGEGEFWFQVSLGEIHNIVDGQLHKIDIRPAE